MSALGAWAQAHAAGLAVVLGGGFLVAMCVAFFAMLIQESNPDWQHPDEPDEPGWSDW